MANPPVVAMALRPSLGARVPVHRADWRFLLPGAAKGSFDHLVLLGGTDTLTQYLLDAGFALRVSREIPPDRSADAIAFLYDAAVSLEKAVACLRPGGALYAEINRRDRESPAMAGIPRLLRTMGLSLKATYWVRPDFERCQAYLPLDGRAIRWYLKTLLTADTPRRLFLKASLAATTRLGDRFIAIPARCCAFTATANGTGRCAASILEHPSLPTELRLPDVLTLMIGRGEGDINRRLVVVPFSRRTASPVAVLKLWRSPERNGLSRREQEILGSIRECLDDGMRRTVPRALGTFCWGPLEVAVESFVAGRLLSTVSRRWLVSSRRKIEDIRLLGAWLAEFHSQAQVGMQTWTLSELEKWVEAPVAAYNRLLGLAPPEERLMVELRSRARSLLGTRFPCVWAHGDLNVSNVCRDRGHLGVLDWAGAAVGLPLADFLSFLMSYIGRRARDEGERLRRFRGIFVPAGDADRVSAAARAAIQEYMVRLGLDPRFFPLIVVVTWVNRAIRHEERRRRAGETAADPRAQNPYVPYVLALAEQSDGMFSPEAEQRDPMATEERHA